MRVSRVIDSVSVKSWDFNAHIGCLMVRMFTGCPYRIHSLLIIYTTITPHTQVLLLSSTKYYFNIYVEFPFIRNNIY